MTEGFKGWVMLELLGHRTRWCWVSETVIAGVKFLRVDVPKKVEGRNEPPPALARPTRQYCEDDEAAPPKEAQAFEIESTEFYPPSSVFCITPTTADHVRLECDPSTKIVNGKKWENPDDVRF